MVSKTMFTIYNRFGCCETDSTILRRGFTALLQGIQGRGKTERDENVA